MAVDKKLPLQTSNNANVAAGKTIEETYQKKTQLEHILLRPDTYIGSIEKHTQTLWVYEDNEMVQRSITYVPGLYKIFDEILVNAADNKQRCPSMDAVKVTIDAEQNCISVYNTGDGVPVEIHQEERVYVPELIFGHLLTSSNYDDSQKKTTGGRNGYGAKLTNIFSTEFVIETADGKRHKKYKQVFKDNMGTKTDPHITKCKEGENWTKVTFKPDLAKFNMEKLEDDVVALMKKRVVDIAGCLGKTVKVELNGQRLPVKSFPDYVNLYLNSASKSRGPESPLPRIVEKVNDRWEVCLSLSEGQFQQVSFVNSIATIKGGTHVDYVTNQITNYVIGLVNKKKKNANVKAHNVKNHIWVFVNALIDNPAFDSQTKETLTIRQSSFGSKCELSEDFLKKVGKCGVVESLLSWADFKQSKDLKKTDGTKKQTLTGIPKLEDAIQAGTRRSGECTLILTEGDSAKALAMAGLSVVGKDTYGVFPLRGKLLNVREASHKQIMENAEIQNIKQIIGLQHGKAYESVNSLRYGSLMIMTDQDHDGSHIKGLLINFIHSFWPSLLKVRNFMVEFITPIVKATHKNGQVISFYSMPEYENWKESLGGNASGWSIKYYKGLGTSTSKEGKEYFEKLGRHKKDFIWVDEDDGNAIELAFSKKKIEARKNWLRHFEHGTYLDQEQKLIKYSEFINKELILFSMADLQRSIPSMVDGLKPGQRKILFCCFKRNFVKEAKVAQFSGYVSEHSAYHHGEQSLAGTIIGMAQDFVGSNNINLLVPGGQFGTRYQGGKDHASARYIYTRLSPITRFLFAKDDDCLLDYLNEDGQSIEPFWYMPVIPTVLVNGSEGIGTGWSTYIPNYNPRDIIANIRRLLNGEMMEPMDPWFKGFRGTIEKSAAKEGGGNSYTVNGVVEEVNETTLRVTELPLRRWTQDYKEFLESVLTSNDKAKDPFIAEVNERSDDTTVHVDLVFESAKLEMVRQEGLMKKLKLTTTISTSNMHLFDARGVIKKYDTPDQILEEFFHLRLEFYEKRKRVLLENLELELLKLSNKARFILAVVSGEIIVNNRKRAELFHELHEKGYTPFPKKIKPSEAIAVAGATDGVDENEDNSVVANGVRASDYDYLLALAIGTLTLEKVRELCADKEKMEREVEQLKKSSAETLWNKDLDALDKELDEQDKRDKKIEEDRLIRRENLMKKDGVKGSKPAPKNPRKKKAPAASTSETITESMETSGGGSPMETENVPAVAKPKGGRARKAPAKKDKPIVLDEEENEDMLELKNRLEAHNINSSPEHSAAMEDVEIPAKKKQPPKRTAAQKKKITISDDEDDDDEVFEIEVAKKGGRKPAAGKGAAAKPPVAPAAAKKRGPAAKKQPPASQKLLTDMLKPAEDSGISPEKKVRKMRASPFNKKSGSVLGRVAGNEETATGSEENVGESGGSAASETSEVMAARARPQRAAAARVVSKYVISDSEEEEEDDEEEEVSSDSVFDGDSD